MTALIMAGGGPGLAAAVLSAFPPPVRLADGTLIPQGEKKHLLSAAGIEELEGELLKVPGSTECKELHLEHLFQPGVYLRKITMPAGSFVIGAEHQEAHFNIILTGRCSVIAEGKILDLNAGDVFFSNAGVRKVLQMHETVEWITVHPNPTEERDIVSLERRLAIMSPTHQAYFEKLKPHDAENQSD